MYFKSASGSKEPSRFKMSSHIPVNHKKKQGSLYSNFKRIHQLNLCYRTATILPTDGRWQWRQHHNIMRPLNYFCSCIKTKSINKFLTHNSLFIFRLSNKKVCSHVDIPLAPSYGDYNSPLGQVAWICNNVSNLSDSNHMITEKLGHLQ